MKIICIGRNYAEHARELQNAVPESPMFFMKPESALLLRNRPFYYPNFSTDIHFETELVVRINKVGKNIDEKFAHRYYHEIALGVDFTARDLQRIAKEKGHPWEAAKAFDQSAVLSDFVNLGEFGAIQDLHFTLDIDGERKQTGHTADMLFTVDKLIAHVSQFMTLKIGDLLYTGTPAGVGPVTIGNQLVGLLEQTEMFNFAIK